MKRMFVFVLLVWMILSGLTSCAKKEPVSSDVQSSPVQKAEAQIGKDQTENVQNADNSEEELQQYIDRFAARSVYRDLLVPNQYLLMGDTRIVQLLLIPGLSNYMAVDREDIVRVEVTEIDEIAMLQIIDKTNAGISMTLSPDQADQVQKDLKQ